MIDEELDLEFEQLLKATLAEMIPKVQGAARAAAAHVPDEQSHESWITSDHGDVPPPARRHVWVGVAAAAITALTVGGLAVIAGRDNSPPAASSPSEEAVDTTPTATPDAPVWYPPASRCIARSLPTRCAHPCDRAPSRVRRHQPWRRQVTGHLHRDRRLLQRTSIGRRCHRRMGPGSAGVDGPHT